MTGLVDHLGNPIVRRALGEEQAAPTLTGVRSVTTGHPEAGLTPRRLARLLRDAEDGDATRYVELAEAMEEKDLHYLAVLGTRKRQVSQLDVTVEAAGEDAQSKRHADLVRDWLTRESLEDEFFDVLDAIGKGFSVLEIMWDTSEKQWRPSRLEYRDPRWFEFDRTDGRTLLLRGEGGQLEPLAPFKFVTHFHKAKSGLPIRGGLARPIAWAYLFKNYDVKGWVAFAEVYGQPLRLGKYHPGAAPEDRAALLRAVANISRDAAAIIPESMAIAFVKSEIRGSTDLFERLANYFDTQVSKAVLGQTTTTDAISGGHAVSKEHDKVREDIERSDAKQLSAVMNRDVVRPMIDLNFGPQKAYPRLRVGRPEEIDVKQFTESLEVVVPMGLPVSKKNVRDKLRLREPEDDDDTLAPAPAAAPPPQAETASALAGAEAAPPDPIETAIAEALGDWEAVMEPVVGPIGDLLGEVDSIEAFRDRLAETLKAMDPAAVGELLARLNFAANIAGQVEADLGED